MLLRAPLALERDRRRTEKLLEQTRRDLDGVRERCKSLRGFFAEAWPVLEPTTPFIPGFHHDAIAEHLQAITRGEITRLQINVPPGMSKSLMTSVMWGAYEWGPAELPGLRFFTTSYKEDYARRDSRKMRDLVQSEWYRMLWPDVILTRDSESDYENTRKGNRKAIPFTSLTSGRGNRLIIDDPHSTESAESDAERDRSTRIFRESATSRLNDPVRDAIVVIMHRLHPEDVCGIIEQLELPYVKLVLPMEFMRSTMIVTPFFKDPRTEEGELLCPERYTREIIEQNKIELGNYAYDTQYQQLPRAREGMQFFKQEDLLSDEKLPVPSPARCDAVFAIIDSATKTGKVHDGTGVVYFALTKFPSPTLFILDWDITQIEGSLLEIWLPTVLERCEELAKQSGARIGSLGAWIEDKNSGTILLQQANRKNLAARAIEGKLVALGKDGRGLSVSGYVNKKQVKITEHAFDKTTPYKGKVRNHLLYQVLGFRMGAGTSSDEDDLFDGFCYGIALALGNSEGF